MFTGSCLLLRILEMRDQLACSTVAHCNLQDSRHACAMLAVCCFLARPYRLHALCRPSS